MPKSKRNRLVSLTATKKKTNLKSNLVEEIQKCVDHYPNIFVFRVDDMRNAKLKELRLQLKQNSRLFFGKNKVMAIALGRSAENEYKDGLHKVSAHLVGQCGLLFTKLTKKEVLDLFEEFRAPDFARTGDIASRSLQLYAGPLEQFPHNIEPYLRSLGMPTSLQRGVVTLVRDFEVCAKNKPLSSEQARMLKLLGYQFAEFRLKLDCLWSIDGKFEEFVAAPKGQREEEFDPEDGEGEAENIDINMEEEKPKKKKKSEGSKKSTATKKEKKPIVKSDRSLRSSVSRKAKA